MVKRWFDRQLMAGSRVGYLHQLLAGSVWASIFALPLIREQTLVIAGFDDPVVPLANATIMHQLLPHSTLHPHAGGHVDLTANAAELVPVLVSTAALASSRPSAARERVSRRSRARACPPRATGPAAGCAPRRRRPNPLTSHGDPPYRLAQQTRIGRIGHIRRHHRGVRPYPVGAQHLRSAALANSASLSPSTAALPHQVVSFINVVGCGTDPSRPIRQNRRQVIESLTSRHSDSYLSRYRNFRNINRR